MNEPILALPFFFKDHVLCGHTLKLLRGVSTFEECQMRCVLALEMPRLYYT